MVKLTRLNNRGLVINAEMIEFVEAIPDTMITLLSGKKIMVTESVEEVVEGIIEYKKKSNEPLFSGVR